MPYVHAVGDDRGPFVIQFQAEDVCERHQPVSARGEQFPDAGVAELGDLGLHRRLPFREQPLDLIEFRDVGDAREPEPGHLVQRRSDLRERGHPARDRDHESGPGPEPRRGGPTAPGDQLGLDPLESRGQFRPAEKRFLFAPHMAEPNSATGGAAPGFRWDVGSGCGF